MRILVLGAGAIGGYFGGRLLAAGRDVTFLVRPRRAAQLAQHGLVVRSPRGDLDLADPPTVQAGAIAVPYDLVLLSCKAYDLEDAIASLAGAVGPDTAILPLLNGMRHLEALDAAFGAAHVLGGQCAISTTLGPDGEVRHLGELHALAFGERDGTLSPRARAIEARLQNAGFDARASETALLDMWEKWVFLASLGAITCLMRAPIGDIVAAGGAALVRQLLEECRATAAAAGHAPRPAFVARTEAMLTAEGSPMTASILRDVESGGRVEADQILGDLLARHDALTNVPAVVLRAAYVNLKAYEARRARQASGKP